MDLAHLYAVSRLVEEAVPRRTLQSIGTHERQSFLALGLASSI